LEAKHIHLDLPQQQVQLQLVEHRKLVILP